MPPIPHNGQDRPHVVDRSPDRSEQGSPVRSIARRATPDDIVPRLIALGMGPEAADHLATVQPERRIADALDAVEELAAQRPVAAPLAWVEAAITQRWDLAGLLARRRTTERRLASVEADRQAHERVRDAYPAWRAIADRWDVAISAALDDTHLARAIHAATAPVAGIGRRSIPVVRAELVAWAIDVHERHPELPLPDALTADLGAGPATARPCEWPLPEPPEPEADRPDGMATLADRIARALDSSHELTEDLAPSLERTTPQRRVDAARGLQP